MLSNGGAGMIGGERDEKRVDLYWAIVEKIVQELEGAVDE